MKFEQVINQLSAVGVSCSSFSHKNVPIVAEQDQEITALVVAAHDKQDGDSEIADLKTHLGAESDEWTAYVEARKTPISEQRQARYRDETDPMRLKIDEDYTPGSQEWNSALEDWKTAKNQIREDLPYPVS
jgi:hypothetical protein